MAGIEWVREERRDRGGRDRGERKSCAKMIMHLDSRARGFVLDFWKRSKELMKRESGVKRN
jgi:hypothetical protein